MSLECWNQPAVDLVVDDSQRGEHNLSDYWSESPVVLYFHRHFG